MNGITRRWINRSGGDARVPSAWRRLSPAQLFVGSFLLLVLTGTVGFRVLPGLYTGERLGWVDALFTATSAVCVTGLIVVDTATYFTRLGQLYLLVLIQLGGLGMITFTSLIIVALGRRLSLRQERLVGPDIVHIVSYDRLTRHVVGFTVLFEAVGALLLYLAFVPRLGWSDAAWPAVFHAVSAFCNAGFSTFTTSLVEFRDAPIVLTLIMLLIVAGGVGFLTMVELRHWRRVRRSGAAYRLSVHSRLVLVTTAVLLAGGWILFAAFEWRGTLGPMSPLDRVVNALFLSTTTRTAGFNAVDHAAMTDSSNFLSILLMFVGGSPGSTAGGIKTTTLALLALLAVARFRGREVVHVGGRSVPEETVQRAVGLAATAFALVTASIFVLTLSEHSGTPHPARGDFLTFMFESVSAFNTVGLSMGATPELSRVGRWVVIVLMFVGRVGPLTFAAALALAARRHRVPYRYATEDVVVG
jgi:trk system potassium uptake protein TrkH